MEEEQGSLACEGEVSPQPTGAEEGTADGGVPGRVPASPGRLRFPAAAGGEGRPDAAAEASDRSRLHAAPPSAAEKAGRTGPGRRREGAGLGTMAAPGALLVMGVSGSGK